MRATAQTTIKTRRLSPRKEPRQLRAAVTRDAILQAAAHILDNAGLAAFNTNRVAEVAGVSIGSLYQYYPNKDALLMALSVQQHVDLAAALEQEIIRVQGRGLVHTARALVLVALKQQFTRPQLAATLDYVERSLPPSPELAAQRQMLLTLLVGALGPYRADIAGNLREAALDLQAMVQSMLDGAAARGEGNTVALRRRIERAVLGYLLGPRQQT